MKRKSALRGDCGDNTKNRKRATDAQRRSPRSPLVPEIHHFRSSSRNDRSGAPPSSATNARDGEAQRWGRRTLGPISVIRWADRSRKNASNLTCFFPALPRLLQKDELSLLFSVFSSLTVIISCTSFLSFATFCQ